ncbi:hypothetical protein FRX31_015349, partial [Thalictrum thalictroides]
MAEIWKGRNKRLFEEISFDAYSCSYKVRWWLRAAGKLSKGTPRIHSTDGAILRKLGVNASIPAAPRIRPCKWIPPDFGFIKLNCDGAAKGNPGPAGVGVVYRDDHGNVIGALSMGMGATTSFCAECEAIMQGVEWALRNNWTMLWVETDSVAACHSFGKNQVPWHMITRWNLAIKGLQRLIISSTWRE